jgi:hypothetical protein
MITMITFVIELSLHSALANLDAVLPPFADAISKYTGMVTIVTVVGPSSKQNGDVIVQR